MPADAVVTFATAEQLLAVTHAWPMPQWVRVWNKLPGQKPVTRFENRKVAVERLWRVVERLDELRQTAGKRTPGKKKPDAGSKSERILALLQRPGGATLPMLMEATGWQAHSVRGFLSGKVSKQMGLPVQSTRREGERVYALSDASLPQVGRNISRQSSRGMK